MVAATRWWPNGLPTKFEILPPENQTVDRIDRRACVRTRRDHQRLQRGEGPGTISLASALRSDSTRCNAAVAYLDLGLDL